jgi:hypothetical protein
MRGSVRSRRVSRNLGAVAAGQAQQQQQADVQQQQAAYGKARAACLEARGYSVK